MDLTHDSLLIQWRVDSYGEKYSLRIDNETGVVVGNRIILNEIPDRQFGIIISGMTETNLIVEPTDFKVNYTNGTIYFHPSLEGSSVTVGTYYGKGVIMYPASRIYLNDSVLGLITLEEKIQDLEQKILNL